MLKHLHIENYVLIKNLDLDFTEGFSVITGQTGAGKSIMLGALNLALGAKADSKSIFQDEKKCVIEVCFDIKGYNLEGFFDENDLDYSEECIIRRELLDSGKSRSFLNDTPVPVSVLKQFGRQVIDIHSQHSSLLLESNAFQLNVLDSVAGNSDLLGKYASKYDSYKSVCKSLIEKREAAANARDNSDYLQFQYNQLVESNLKPGEMQMLEEQINTLEHISEVKNGLESSLNILNSDEGVLSGLHRLESTLEDISSYGNMYESLLQRVESCHIELKDICDDLEKKSESMDLDPSELETMQERLSGIYTLLQKHKVSTEEELIEIRDSIGLQLGRMESFDEDIENLKREKESIYSDLTELSAELTKNRTAVIKQTENYIEEHLKFLGMPDSKFVVNITKSADITPTGSDVVQFLFSSNKTNPQPIQSSASGGEISRVMLCLKALTATRNNLPTLIFDEIDTGISGNIASQMGSILKEMSGGMQVICITHLPQVAAKGITHYTVYKDNKTNPVQTYVKMLDKDERVGEIAGMLSGDNITEAAIANAKELINIAPAR